MIGFLHRLSTPGLLEAFYQGPGPHVGSAFSRLSSQVLFPVFQAREEMSPPYPIFCGDTEGAKKTVVGLIRDAGFNPVWTEAHCKPPAMSSHLGL